MSIVVAFVRDGKVYMGSDSRTTANIAYITSSKVWKKGDILYGVVGNADACAAIQHGCKLPPGFFKNSAVTAENVELEHFIYHSVLSRVKEAMVKAGVAEPVFNLLVGWEGRLFIVEENSVFEVLRGYAAIGSAEQIAYGALYAKTSQRGVKPDPENVVRCAIDACNELSPDCGKPVVVRS